MKIIVITLTKNTLVAVVLTFNTGGQLPSFAQVLPKNAIEIGF
ncbi:MAG: hypothetical protein WA749_13530 [Gelidibacter sp.]